MQTKAILILALLCTSTSINSYANLNGCVDTTNSEKKTAIYYANGILTSPDDADDMAVKMEVAYKNQFEVLGAGFAICDLGI